MVTCAVEYPVEMPVECIREILRIVRAGRWVEERAAFAKHGWSVQGYLQRLLLGEPQPVIGATPCTDESALLALESLERQSIAQAEGAAQQALPVPLAALIDWLVRKLLEALLRR